MSDVKNLHTLIANSSIDFGKQSEDYSKHRPGFPSSFYDRLERYFPIKDQAILDLGTGPGTVAGELAARGAQVVGIDIAQGQIQAAQARNLKNCR